MFANNVVLIGENRQMLEDKLRRWREGLGRNGSKISRVKTEFLEFGNVAGNYQSGGGVRLVGQILNRVDQFKYLGSVVFIQYFQ